MDNNDILRGAGNEAQRQTHVGAARERLSRALSQIEKASSALEQRLQAVLTGDAPIPADPQTRGIDKGSGIVPLAQSLNEDGERLDAVGKFLGRLLTRIEL